MTQIICDHCGRVIDKNNRIFLHLDTALAPNYQLPTYSANMADLCCDCTDKLIKEFLNKE